MLKFKNEELKTKCLNDNIKELAKELEKIQFVNAEDGKYIPALALATNTEVNDKINKIIEKLNLIKDLQNKNIDYDIESESYIYNNNLLLYKDCVVKE